MNWFSTYPRKIGYPTKIVCKNRKEFVDLYNRMNGYVNKLYVGMYACDELGNTDNVLLNVAALDIDWEGKYDTMVEVHNSLMKRSVPHQVLFSTNGFWIYAMCLPCTFPKEIAKGKLAAIQEALLEGTSAYFGKSKEAPIDYAIRGDVERLTRMPSSFDKTRGRYAIFLHQADIDAGYDHIVSLSTLCADQRRFEIITFCEEGPLIDPNVYEAKRVHINSNVTELTEVEYTYKIPDTISDQHKKIFSIFPKFMHGWILNKDMATWQARSYVTLYMREKGFSLQQTKDFLKPYYSAMSRSDEYGDNWSHYEGVKTGDLIYKRLDLKFPNYETLATLGLCSWKEVEKYGSRKSPAYR